MLFAKGKGMRSRIRIFLILTAAAVMMAGCAAGEGGLSFTDGLAYDETYAHCMLVDYNIDVKKALREHPEFEEIICPIEDIF